jgi:hypothetical protein
VLQNSIRRLLHIWEFQDKIPSSKTIKHLNTFGFQRLFLAKNMPQTKNINLKIKSKAFHYAKVTRF